jgi:hypothetical protein
MAMSTDDQRDQLTEHDYLTPEAVAGLVGQTAPLRSHDQTVGEAKVVDAQLTDDGLALTVRLPRSGEVPDLLGDCDFSLGSVRAEPGQALLDLVDRALSGQGKGLEVEVAMPATCSAPPIHSLRFSGGDDGS